MRNASIILILAFVVPFHLAIPQPTTPTPSRVVLELDGPRLLNDPSPSPPLAELMAPGETGEDKKDPAYTTYKDGYDAILGERWADAVKKFENVTTKYPKSDYVDDAEYWRAYALSHTNRKKAVEAYKLFMEKYPHSRYVDDAVSDLGNLDQTVVVAAQEAGNSNGVSSHGYAFAVTPSPGVPHAELRKQEAAMRKLNREMGRNFGPRLRIPSIALRVPSMALWDSDREENLDPDTRVRLEALYAIGDTREDETAFQTLRDVALDRGQNIRLRQAAIEVLSDFKKFDVMPVFLELAKKDTNERIQDAAIEFIGRANKDKNKSVDALVVLFKSMPGTRKEKLETVLFTIADVGNDKAIDFLATIARTHENYELRSDAVYYLGTIGGDRSRAALYQILKNK